ncbi:MAG: AMP-binding protein [Magnetococcales bacterium]|nr:AMP-binding protein [Magnetococcales bacterium]MBF0174970.1 AMP-binding protein [Magnetococcales bacterium]MBF0632828.1 AMP-binding protein [Magnetococcales bacterium]
MWRDFIKEKAESIPDHAAIIDRIHHRSWSYAALEREIEAWTCWLYRQGVIKGDRVAYLAPNRLEHLTLFFACAKLGAILVSLNHRLSPRELAAIISHVEPRVLLGEGPPTFDSSFTWHDVLTLTRDNHDFATIPRYEAADEDPLLMLYTSGSTGDPKGVLFHARMLMANMEHTIGTGVLEPRDISIINTPFFHTGAYNVFTLPLLSIGGTMILFERFDPAGVLDAIRDDGVNVFWAVPTMFQAIHDHPRFAETDFSRIRVLLSGGAPLNLPLIRAYHEKGVPFKQGFGLTEVGPNCFLHQTEDSWERPDSIGKPMPHSQTRIVNDQGKEVGINEVGELLLGGPHVCKGYWRDEKRFRESLRDGFFATGDLVRRDTEGFFYVVGRKKEMYISGGENVFPGEVEKQLVAHPDIRQAVVVSVPDDKWTEVGFAWIVADREVDLESLRTWLNPRLGRYKHPQHLERIPELPLLANGKIDRLALADRAREKVGKG